MRSSSWTPNEPRRRDSHRFAARLALAQLAAVAICLAVARSICAAAETTDLPARQAVERYVQQHLQPSFPHLIFRTKECLVISKRPSWECKAYAGAALLRYQVVSRNGVITVNPVDVLWDRTSMEAIVGAEFSREYGDHIEARCGDRNQISGPIGSSQACQLIFPGGVKHTVSVAMTSVDGGIRIGRPNGIKSNFDEKLDAVLAEHKRGLPTIIPGHTAELLTSQLVVPAQWPPSQEARVVCPAHLDLTGDKRGACVLDIGGSRTNYAVWVDDSADLLKVQEDELPVETSKIVGIIGQKLTARLRDLRINDAFVLDCGSAFVVLVAPRRTMECKVFADGRMLKLTVIFRDRRGTMDLHFDQ